MITSSKFFNKSFFTLDYAEDKPQPDQLSPWGKVSMSQALDDKNRGSPQLKSKDNEANRGYEISRNSSIKYI